MMRYVLVLIFFLFSITSFSEPSKNNPRDASHPAACRCRPNQACWPANQEWQSLQQSLTGRLSKPVSPIAACKEDWASQSCQLAIKNIHNPFFNESISGGTQSQGWLNGWDSQVSDYAVEASTTEDVVAAVNFARKHHLKLVIKGTGHDYLGRSNAPDSLLIWTHNMRHTSYDPAFVPNGCHQRPVPAITVGAGTRWLEAYQEATGKHHRYVQGGGCTTVGAAGGFIQGGGFGSFSKKFGTGAGGVLQAELVTANGKVITANPCQHPDIFWAIRGGGGGTFGVVTKVTLKTHALPNYFGIVSGSISANNDESYQKLVQQFLIFFRQQLNNEHWGEQFSFHSNNTIQLTLLFQGLNKKQVEKIWSPLRNWIAKHPDSYTMQMNIEIVPADKMWDDVYLAKHIPTWISNNQSEQASKGEYWWTPNTQEVSKYWYTYQSWWLPLAFFADNHIKQASDTLFQASRHVTVTLHINKGLAGASPDAIRHGRETSINPAVYDAAALAIMGSGNNQVYPQLKNHEVNLQEAKQIVQYTQQAMHLLMKAAPQSGAYVNEADYFQKDWQTVFWGKNYAKLLQIKRKYDPAGVFYCHHCVGSEEWSDDGMCKI